MRGISCEVDNSPGSVPKSFMGKKKNYIFTNKRHSNKGIMSVILGIISLAALGAAVFLSYRSGDAAVRSGFTGLLAAIFSLTGAVLGTAAVCDRNYYKIFPVLGVLLNLLALGCVSLILYAGANL